MDRLDPATDLAAFRRPTRLRASDLKAPGTVRRERQSSPTHASPRRLWDVSDLVHLLIESESKKAA
jgi:hypothetical protein